jgi:hypothetical protein
MREVDQPVCHGIRSDAIPYSDEYRQRIRALLPKVLAEFAKDVGDKDVQFPEPVSIGTNVGSESSVIWTMQSWYQQLNTITDDQLSRLIYDALHDCARRDHWYRHEKEWE